MSDDKFWTMNPRTLQPWFDGHFEWRKEQDYISYYQGVYFYEAVTTSLANMFRKKGAKVIPYRDKPFYDSIDASRESEVEKKAKTEAFFNNLMIMQANFEINHKGDD